MTNETKTVVDTGGTFAYIGDNDSTELFDLEFERESPVEVDNPKFASKLRGNPDFVEIIGGAQVTARQASTASKTEAKAKPVVKSRAKAKALAEGKAAKEDKELV